MAAGENSLQVGAGDESVAAALEVLADVRRPFGSYKDRVADALQRALPHLQKQFEAALLSDGPVRAGGKAIFSATNPARRMTTSEYHAYLYKAGVKAALATSKEANHAD